jgi:hypothetical protein
MGKSLFCIALLIGIPCVLTGQKQCTRSLTLQEMRQCLGGDDCIQVPDAKCMVWEEFCVPEVSDCLTFAIGGCTGQHWIASNNSEKKFCTQEFVNNFCETCAPTGHCKRYVTCQWNYIESRCENSAATQWVGGVCTSNPL